MKKVPDHVTAAIEECRRYGAEFKYEIKQSNIKALIILNNQSRQIFLSKTPSDFRVPLKVKCNCRKLIAEIKKCTVNELIHGTS